MFDDRVTPALLRKMRKDKSIRPNPLPPGESIAANMDRMIRKIFEYGPSRETKRSKKRSKKRD